ncbi:caspase family protein [Actinoplanes utahensis]|uniref:Peptidase C14 caspase domain-containing protein n=1 Tax=Actinoplanes utahensis TaxID=1869 RepID=A0A0A6UU74_ACTUT|nr:caspase family protein [Actinoplanes utahensis]KHD78014.1 hypothetical protein MB27_07880 [Actinoplanes utahensis]GIF30014.1 hypothetical protein Aut01nite_30000 [Actinoplanes utahensis]
MTTVYALFTGIDAYQAAPRLGGCVNDVTAAQAYLESRAGGALRPLALHDGKATRDAMIDGVRHHLGRARTGDTALFWYAGHGSQAPLPPELSHLEPSGRMQTLICADSRLGDVPDLYDKELSVLLGRVAATGCRVVTVLDCCHAAGAVRGEIPEPAGRDRWAPPAAAAPRPELLIPELRSGWAALPDHSRLTGLAACRSDQRARERPLGGRPHGVFSWALLGALNQLGPAATYRELLAAARCQVENLVYEQTPQLIGDDPADRVFLGGVLRTPASGITLRHHRGQWEIDAGLCHGVPSPGAVRVAVAGPGPQRPARVVEVLTGRSIVEPVGWAPDPAVQYPVVFTALPRPALTVALGDRNRDLLHDRLAGSPWLRLPETGEPAVPDLRLDLPAPGRARILGSDHLPVTGDLAAADDEAAATLAIRGGEHIARWRHIRTLANPVSPLAGLIRLEIVAAHPGERIMPPDRPALQPDDDGLIRLAYRPGPGGPVAPEVFLRLHNTGDLPLYCALLDLTGRYRIHARLMPGAFVGPRHRTAVADGRRIAFTLPAGRPPEPGAHIHDWLKLIVATDEFASTPFEQPTLDEALVQPRTSTRDAGPDGHEWATATLGVLTTVPR